MKKGPNNGDPSRYLTVACLVVSVENVELLNRICKKLRKKINRKSKKTDEIKSINLDSNHRRFIFEQLKDLKSIDRNFQIHSRSVLKKNVLTPSLRHEPCLLFNYLTGKCIHDVLSDYDSFKFHIDNRNTKIKKLNAKHNLKSYLLKNLEPVGKEIVFVDSKQFSGVQISDVISNTIWRNYERGARFDFDTLVKSEILTTQQTIF